MKRPRRYLSLLLSAIVFVAVLFVIDRAVSVADFNATVGGSLNDLPVYEKGADVLFLGDSRTHQGVDAAEFEIIAEKSTGRTLSAYNLARPAMQTPFFHLLTKRIFDSPTAMRPKVIFLNLSFYLLGGQRGYLRDIYLSNVTPRWYEVVDLYSTGLISSTEALQWMLKPRLPLWKHNGVARNLAFRFAENPITLPKTIRGEVDLRLYQDKPSNNGGFSLGSTQVPVEDIKFAYSSGTEEAVHLEYLRRFLESAMKNDVPVVIYEFPWPDHPELNDGRLMKIRAYYRDLIIDQAAGMPNVQYVFEDNYWPPHLFFDQQHLNEVGAQRLTAYLAALYMKLTAGQKLGITPRPLTTQPRDRELNSASR